MAGRDDIIFPPEHQRELAAAIPHAHLRLIERAGHNPHAEQPAEVMRAIRDFLSPYAPMGGQAHPARPAPPA